MEILSVVALILLSLLGYSTGAVSAAGKSAYLKPAIIDLALVGLVWTGAIWSKSNLDLNKWLLVLIWLVLGAFVGMTSTRSRKSSLQKLLVPAKDPSLDVRKGLRQAWKDFSLRLGGFQSRVWLSLFFFVFISPAAIIVKTFADPLRIKKCGRKSHWLPKKEPGSDLGQYRKQF